MGKWFQHCWEGTAAALCCWRMTDFLFSLPLTLPSLYSVPLFLSLHSCSLASAFLFLVSLSLGPFFSGFRSPSRSLCTAGSSHHRACKHTQTLYTITRKGMQLSKYIPRNISPRNFNSALSHFSHMEKKDLTCCSLTEWNKACYWVCACVRFIVWAGYVQMSPQERISRGCTVKLSFVSKK